MKHEALKTKRAELADEVSMTYSPDDFPGSKNYMVACAAQKALADFDAEYPQIIAEIKAKRETEQKARANELLSRQGGWYD